MIFLRDFVNHIVNHILIVVRADNRIDGFRIIRADNAGKHLHLGQIQIFLVRIKNHRTRLTAVYNLRIRNPNRVQVRVFKPICQNRDTVVAQNKTLRSRPNRFFNRKIDVCVALKIAHVFLKQPALQIPRCLVNQNRKQLLRVNNCSAAHHRIVAQKLKRRAVERDFYRKRFVFVQRDFLQTVFVNKNRRLNLVNAVLKTVNCLFERLKRTENLA